VSSRGAGQVMLVTTGGEAGCGRPLNLVFSGAGESWTRLELRRSLYRPSFLAAYGEFCAAVMVPRPKGGPVDRGGPVRIYALPGVGAWCCITRSTSRCGTRSVSRVLSAAQPRRPLLPVMAADHGVDPTNSLVLSLSDVTEVAPRRWSPITRGQESLTDELPRPEPFFPGSV